MSVVPKPGTSWPSWVPVPDRIAIASFRLSTSN
jgi:hypothetical protein